MMIPKDRQRKGDTHFQKQSRKTPSQTTIPSHPPEEYLQNKSTARNASLESSAQREARKPKPEASTLPHLQPAL
jgi:hypothetical protein